MKLNNLIISASICLTLLFLIPVQNSYSHGWRIDTASIDIDGREISVSIEIV